LAGPPSQTAGGAYSAPSDPLAGFQETFFDERNEKERESENLEKNLPRYVPASPPTVAEGRQLAYSAVRAKNKELSLHLYRRL